MDLSSLLSQVPQDTLLILLAYTVLGGLYLVVVPLALYAWMNQRWHRMGKLERLGIYGLVFLFFPGYDSVCPLPQFPAERARRRLN